MRNRLDARSRAEGQIEAMREVLLFMDTHPDAGRGSIAAFCETFAAGRNRVIGRLDQRRRGPAPADAGKSTSG